MFATYQGKHYQSSENQGDYFRKMTNGGGMDKSMEVALACSVSSTSRSEHVVVAVGTLLIR
eukprot:gene4626-14819_t